MINLLPRQRKKSHGRWMVIVIIFIIVAATYYFFTLNAANSNNPAAKGVVIQPGDGVTAISQQLSDAGLIRSALMFQLYVRQAGLSSRLQSGEYFLNQNLSMREVANILSRGAAL